MLALMAPKIVIPEQLKQDLPQTPWGKILSITPIIMTVIATLLAGLASSEMTRAQYDRSLAAELQSKAGDQWGYYQAKKLRSALAQNTLDLLAATSDLIPLESAAVPGADAATLAALTQGQLPVAPPAHFADGVQAALNLVVNSRPEAEVAAVLAPVPRPAVAQALTDALQVVGNFDAATKPINQAVDQLGASVAKGDKSALRAFSAARLRYTAARYEIEARLNMAVAGIYELQVRQSNYSADKHRARSTKFFFGMLAAQLAVIVSTFAIAARQRSFLWSIAAAAGAAAVAFSLYVFLYV